MSEQREKTVCFTGHRRILHKDVEKRLEEIISVLAEDGFVNFIAGGALGFDTLAEKCVLRLKEKYPFIRLLIALPYRAHGTNWGDKHFDEYKSIVSRADAVVVLSEEYHRGCMHVRNRYIVDCSSVCVSYRYKKTGGTAYTEDYAIKKGLTVISVV